MRTFNYISWDLSLPSLSFLFCNLSDSIWTKVGKTIEKYSVFHHSLPSCFVVNNTIVQIFWNFHRWERRQGFQKLNFWWMISKMQRNGIVHAAAMWWLAVTSKSVLGNHKQIHQQWVLSKEALSGLPCF